MGWKYLGASIEGSPFYIKGSDVWKFKWKRLGDEQVDVKDPQYGQYFKFDIWEIPPGIRFVAGEFSNGIFGFYINE